MVCFVNVHHCLWCLRSRSCIPRLVRTYVHVYARCTIERNNRLCWLCCLSFNGHTRWAHLCEPTHPFLLRADYSSLSTTFFLLQRTCTSSTVHFILNKRFRVPKNWTPSIPDIIFDGYIKSQGWRRMSMYQVSKVI
ncbi:hypothetical protein Plhal710r2_c066g0174741 [Plasmopara halstedii]